MSETKKAKRPEKVEFTHVKPDDYKAVYVNGVWGGITTRGDLFCNFFYEYNDVPEKVQMAIDEKGKIGKIISPVVKIPRVRRDLKVAVIMNPEQAVSIANWILQKVKEFQESKKKEGE